MICTLGPLRTVDMENYSNMHFLSISTIRIGPKLHFRRVELINLKANGSKLRRRAYDMKPKYIENSLSAIKTKMQSNLFSN